MPSSSPRNHNYKLFGKCSRNDVMKTSDQEVKSWSVSKLCIFYVNNKLYQLSLGFFILTRPPWVENASSKSACIWIPSSDWIFFTLNKYNQSTQLLMVWVGQCFWLVTYTEYYQIGIWITNYNTGSEYAHLIPHHDADWFNIWPVILFDHSL